MGHQSRIRAEHKAEVIHRTHLFGGRMSAQEVHARFGVRDRCLKCGALPVIQVRVLMHHNDYVERAPLLAAAIAASNPRGQYVPTIPTTYGPMVMVSKVAACKFHQKELEHDAAKAPDYCLIEIDRGPGADRPVVQVA